MSVTITYFNPDTNILYYRNAGSAVTVVPYFKTTSTGSLTLFWGQTFLLNAGAGAIDLSLNFYSATNVVQADQLTWGGQLTLLTGSGSTLAGYTAVSNTFTVLPSTQTATITSVSIATPGVISYTATSASTAIRVYKKGSQVSATNSSISIGSGTITLPAGVPAAAGDSFQLYQIVDTSAIPASNVYTIAAPNPSAGSLTINNITVGTNAVDSWSNHAYTYAAVAVVQRRAGAGTLTSSEFTVAADTNIIYLNNAADGQPITLESGDTVTISSTAAYGSVAVASTYTMPTPSSTSVVITAVDTTVSPAIVTYTFTSADFTTINAYIGVEGVIVRDASNIPVMYTLSVGTNTLPVGYTFTDGDLMNFVATSTYGEDAVSASFTVSVAAPPASPPGSTSVVINSVNLSASPSPLLNYTFTSDTYQSIQANLTINGAVFAPSGTPTIYTLHVGTADTMAPTGLTGGDVLQFVATAEYGGSAVSAPYTIPGGTPTPPAGPSAGAITITSISAAGLVTYTSSYTGSGLVFKIEGQIYPATTFSVTSGSGQTINYATTLSISPILNDYGSNTKTLQIVYPVENAAATEVSNEYALPQGAAPAAPCVCAGTMIRTARGERAVETLTAGDLVLTADGREVAVKGIYTTEIASCTGRNAPYVVAAGAFGRGLPSADLTISPGHALMARPGQWMIPCHTTDPALRAKMSRYANGQEVTYYHVELPNYLQDTFVANGVVSEAYGLNWAKTYKGPSVYTQMSNGYFTRAGGAVARNRKAAVARK